LVCGRGCLGEREAEHLTPARDVVEAAAEAAAFYDANHVRGGMSWDTALTALLSFDIFSLWQR
jgi:hypothetical protein